MVRRMLPAAPGSVTGTNIWINHNKNKTLPRIILPKVLGYGSLAPKSARNVARGAGVICAQKVGHKQKVNEKE